MREILPGHWIDAEWKIVQIVQDGRRLTVEVQFTVGDTGIQRPFSHKFYDWSHARSWAERLVSE